MTDTNTNTKEKFDWKTALSSRGFWGSIVAGFASVATLFGLDGELIKEHFELVISTGVAAVGAVVAFWGRLKAVRPLLKKVEPAEPQA